METIEELQERIKEYTEKGFMKDVVQAAREARLATRLFIRRTHPQTGFGGMQIAKYIQRGKFSLENIGVIGVNIYSNYFARWYLTGAFGRHIKGKGPRQGQKGPTYDPHGSYYEQNAAAIEQYFCSYLLDYLKNHIDL